MDNEITNKNTTPPPPTNSNAIFSDNNTNTTDNSPTVAPTINNASSPQNICTAKDATKNLITNWLVWYIILSVAYILIYNFISPIIESQIIQITISIILQAIIVFIAWTMSTKFTFKNKLLKRSDVRIVMRNLVIFSVIICAINGVYQFIQANNTFNRAIETNYELKVKEKMAEEIYDNQKMQEYYQQKSKAINEAKNQSYIYLGIFELFLVIIFLAILPVERKLITKHTVDSI